MALRNLTAWLSRPIVFPLALFLLMVLAYGLFLPWLGFYWDDLPMLWIGKTYGAEG